MERRGDMCFSEVSNEYGHHFCVRSQSHPGPCESILYKEVSLAGEQDGRGYVIVWAENKFSEKVYVP